MVQLLYQMSISLFIQIYLAAQLYKRTYQLVDKEFLERSGKIPILKIPFKEIQEEPLCRLRIALLYAVCQLIFDFRREVIR